MMMKQRVPIEQTFHLPPELSGAVPREVRLTGAGTAMAVVAGALAIGALVSAILLSLAYTLAEGQRRLREEGRTVEAEVVQVGLRRGEHPRRIVTYRFEVDGRSYTRRITLRERDRRELTKGTLIPVRYIPSHPEMNWVVGFEPDDFPLWIIPLVSLSLLAGAAALVWSLRRQWILLSEGRVAQGRITSQKKVRTGKHQAHRLIAEFQGLGGARYTARYEIGKNPPPIGTLVPIVYHRDNPRRNTTYPLQFVRTSRAPQRGGSPT